MTTYSTTFICVGRSQRVGTRTGFAVGIGISFAVGRGVVFAVGTGTDSAVGLGVGFAVEKRNRVRSWNRKSDF
jgi:hypothetical protein